MLIRKVTFLLLIIALILSGCYAYESCRPYAEISYYETGNEENDLISFDDIFEIIWDRQTQFEGQLKLEVLSAEANLIELRGPDEYRLEVRGKISNMGEQTLIFRRMESSSFQALTGTVSFDIIDSAGNPIQFVVINADTFIPDVPISPDDFIIIDPHECYEVTLTLNIPHAYINGEYVLLPPGEYQLAVSYINIVPGYLVLPEKQEVLDWETFHSLQDGRNFKDINAWVGFTESNYIELIIPNID